MWYNAVVERVLPDTVWVMFTDYGNSDELEKAFVLTNLPIGTLLDEYFKVCMDKLYVVCNLRNNTEGLKFSSNIATLLY